MWVVMTLFVFLATATVLSGYRLKKFFALLIALSAFGWACFSANEREEFPHLFWPGILFGAVASLVYLEELKNQVVESIQDRLTALHMKDILES